MERKWARDGEMKQRRGRATFQEQSFPIFVKKELYFLKHMIN